jgi:hypothetical protein
MLDLNTRIKVIHASERDKIVKQIMKMFNPFPVLTYQTVMDLNAASWTERTKTYWVSST